MPNHVVKRTVQKKGTDWEIVWDAQSDKATQSVRIVMTLPEQGVWYKDGSKKVVKKNAEKIADLVTAVLDYMLED